MRAAHARTQLAAQRLCVAVRVSGRGCNEFCAKLVEVPQHLRTGAYMRPYMRVRAGARSRVCVRVRDGMHVCVRARVCDCICVRECVRACVR